MLTIKFYTEVKMYSTVGLLDFNWPWRATCTESVRGLDSSNVWRELGIYV